MTKEIKISRAYCVELGRNVEIEEAHYESVKDGQPHKIFNFLCTDPVCQQRGVRVIGVAYHQVFSQRKVTPYFRRERKNKQNLNEHHEECEWFLDDAGNHPLN